MPAAPATDRTNPPENTRATLVLGGARSGKSLFAEQLVTDSGLEAVYVATAEAGDNEMSERIRLHRDRRGTRWTTMEEKFDLAGLLENEAGPERAILVDCLTLWLSNCTFGERDIAAETARLCNAVEGLSGPVVFVSNEIGLGLVPDNRLSRDFRDNQGRLNQAVAAACHRVIFVAAGQPLILKPRPTDSIIL